MRTKQFDDLSGGLSGCGQAYKSPRRCVSEKLLRSKRIYVWEVSSGVPDLNVSDGHLSREWLVHRGRRMIYGCVVSPGRSRGSNLLLGPRLKADVVWSVHLLTLTTVSDCARTTYLAYSQFLSHVARTLNGPSFLHRGALLNATAREPMAPGMRRLVHVK